MDASIRNLAKTAWDRAWKREYYSYCYSYCFLLNTSNVFFIQQAALDTFRPPLHVRCYYSSGKPTAPSHRLQDLNLSHLDIADIKPSDDSCNEQQKNPTSPATSHDSNVDTIEKNDALTQLLCILDNIPINHTPCLIEPKQTSRIWLLVDIVCQSPKTSSNLAENHIAKLLFLTIHGQGYDSSRYLSIKHLIHILQHAKRSDLLSPVYLEFLTRYTDRVQYQVLSDILSDLKLHRSHLIAKIFHVVLEILVKQGDVLNVHRWITDFSVSSTLSKQSHTDTFFYTSQHSDFNSINFPSFKTSAHVQNMADPLDRKHSTHSKPLNPPLLNSMKYRWKIWRALKNSNNAQRLSEFFERADPSTISIVEYNSVLGSYLRTGNLDGFQRVWSYITQIDGPVKPDLTSFNLLIRYLLQTKGFSAGLDCFRHINDAGLSPTILEYNILIDFLFKSDESTKAMALFDSLRQSSIIPQASTYTIMINHCAEKRLILNTFKYYYALQESGVVYSAHLWTAMVRAFVKLDDMATAIQCYRDMLADPNVDPNGYTFVHLIEGYFSHNEYMKAFELVGEAAKWGLEDNPAIMSLLTRIRSKTQFDSNQVLQDYYRILPRLKADYAESNLPPHHLSRFYFHLIQHFSHYHLVDICVSIAADMADLGLDVRQVSGHLISVCALTGDINTASDKLQAARRNESTPVCLAVYNNLIVGALHHDKVEFADMIFGEMIHMGLEIRPIVLNSYLKYNLQSDDGMSRTLDRMRKLDVKYNSRTFWLMMFFYGFNKGLMDKAWNMWTRYIEFFGPFIKAYERTSDHVPGGSKIQMLPTHSETRKVLEVRLVRLAIKICHSHGRTRQAEQVLQFSEEFLTPYEFEGIYEVYESTKTMSVWSAGADDIDNQNLPDEDI
ncbi:hypothetical protein BDV3_004764 [Batrachochytrium dendrobatidis]